MEGGDDDDDDDGDGDGDGDGGAGWFFWGGKDDGETLN